MRSLRVVLAAVLLTAGVQACSEFGGPTFTEEVLFELIESSPEDSNGVPTTPPGGIADSGYFRGFVRAPNAPGAGGDTLANGPRIPNVIVRAFPIVGYNSVGPQLGPEAAQVTTNAEGVFTLPKLKGGEYVVTFRPPTASGFFGIYASGPIHATSHEFPWWVTLPRL